MKIEPIWGLSKEARQLYTERLLILHRILGESKDENYEHAFIIHHDMKDRFGHVDDEYARRNWYAAVQAGTHCGTVACAFGHAVWNHQQFPGFEVALDERGRPWRSNTPHDPNYADLYFGPSAWHYIFDSYAYNTSPYRVTRQMAMARIEQYIREGLGCELIEDKTE